jgi:hypothetical protein
MRVLAVLAACIACTSASAYAQSASLAGARAELATYDLTGTRTLDAIRSLGPVIAAHGPDAPEAAYLRAMAAGDLHLAAIGLADAGIDARLADALGVPVDRLGAELHAELTAAATGMYRAPAREEARLVDRAEAPARTLDLGNAREAALYVLAIARDGSAAIQVTGAAAAAPPAWLHGDGAATLARLRTGLVASDRATRAARDGDPLLAAWSPALAAARATLLAVDVRAAPVPPTDAAFALAAADARDPAGSTPDVLVVVGPTGIAVACGARVRATSATEITTTAAAPGCGELGTARTIALPTSLPAVPGPIDTLVAAFTGLGLSSTTAIAIAPTEAAPMHLVTRVVRSLARASLAPSMFALASGSDLRTSPVAIAAATDTAPITVHVRLGGYAIERTHGHDAQVPRVHGDGGLAYDHAGLTTALAPDHATAIAVDGMGTVPAVEVIRTLRQLASSGAHVTLALP